MTLAGEIDIATAPQVRKALADARSQAETGITVDLAGVTFMDACGLGLLAAASRRAERLPAGLKLTAVPGRVLFLLRLTGLDGLVAVPGTAPGARPPPPRRPMGLRGQPGPADGAHASQVPAASGPARDEAR